MDNKVCLGNFVSLIHCKKCGAPLEIFVNEESIECPYCKHKNNLIVDIDFNSFNNDKKG